MATASQIIPIIAEATGTKFATVRWLNRRLVDACVLPKAEGKRIPHYSNREIAKLLLTVLAAPAGANAARVVSEYGDLTELGWSAMPPDKRGPRLTALDAIEFIIRTLSKTDDPDRSKLIRSQVEVVQSWPEVTVTMPSERLRFIPDGVLPNHWQDSKIRTAATLPGIAVSRILNEIEKAEHR